MGQTNEGENVPTSFMPMPIQNQTCENERHKEIEREKESCKYMLEGREVGHLPYDQSSTPNMMELTNSGKSKSDSLFKNLHLILMHQ